MSSSEELVAELNQATAILEAMSEGVLAIDGQGCIVAANPAVRALLGVAGSNLLGSNLFETLRQRELHELVRAVLGGERTVLRDFPIFSPRERVLRAQGVACRAEGEGPQVVVVLQDVTDHHRYDLLRREFVANVSHELKSPLTSIRSLTETLLDGALEDTGSNRRFVTLIEEDVGRLSRLIEDLLILSQIESRAVPLRMSTVELAPLVFSLVAPLQSLILQKHIEVDINIPVGTTVSADPDRLRQILSNLIDNAVKYNNHGGRLDIVAVPQPHSLRLAISDSGPGIPEEDRNRIFERFYRVDKTRSRELGGTGLGLSIVKHLVESHGGRVWVESQLGHGSSFFFTLPLSTAGPQPVMVARDALPAVPLVPSHPEDLEGELSYLQERLLVMAGLVEEAVGRSVQALVVRDGALARQVVERDSAIDLAEMDIDRHCLLLLEKYRPVDRDLRFITMAFKIISELERIGDLAVNIAHRTLELLREPLLRPLIDITRMAELVQAMVKDSLDALVRRDAELAREVCRRDDQVDRLNHRVFREMLASMADDRSKVERSVGLMLVARAMERIADHATNVAEDVVYIVQGKSIKHRGAQHLSE